jgi:trigger factor
MSAKWEKLEGNVGVLTIEVEEAKVNEALTQAFKKVSQKVNLPGFRKGKIPRPIFEKRFGVESLYQEALDIMLPDAYAGAVVEAGINPIDRPEIDVEQMEKGSNLIFKAKVTVKPEVTLGDYKGIEVEEIITSVTDEDIQKELTTLQEKHADLAVIDTEIASGDTAVIDFEGFIDGEAFEGGKGDNYPLEIGSGQFIPGFEEQLIGLKSGDEKSVEVSFPEEYHSKDLAGKAAIFNAKIHEVKRKELPELNDEFAKDVNEEVETLDELKTTIKDKLQKDKDQEAEDYVRDTVVEAAADNATVDIPDVMITSETNRMLQEFGQRLESQGMNLDLYYQFSGTDEAGMREQFTLDAEKRVRINLVLLAIANAENIDATDEAVEAELIKMSETYQRPVDELKKIFAAQGGLEGIKEDIIIQKTVELLVENKK